MLDYNVLLYDPVYGEIGVAATFTSGAMQAALTVIDDTRPKVLPAGTIEMRSVGPGAFARIPELERNGITRDDWMDAGLSFNGRSWVVRSWELRGSPNGEDLGEVRFLLKVVEVVPPPNGGADWVPANAKIHIDFLGGTPQGRAWSNGAEVAIDTLLGSDPNTENGQSPSEYDPSRLTADGYISNPDTGIGLAFIGDARAKVLDAATIVYRTVHVTGDLYSVSYFALLSADGNDAVEIDVGTPTIAYSWNGSASGQLADVPNDVNQIAATITNTRLEAALNGLPVVALTLDETDRPGSNPLVAVYFETVNGQNALQSITIYDPLPDTNGLSELSAIQPARRRGSIRPTRG